MEQSRNPALQKLLRNLTGSDYNSLEDHSIPGLEILESGQMTPTEPQVRTQPMPKLGIPAPDPSLITTWPPAIKHVTKHVTTNEKTVTKIRHLIEEQHKHEKQWWVAREVIVAKHVGRTESQQKAVELLKSLGGVAPVSMKIDSAADEAELIAYDKKVYGLLLKMASDIDRQLRSMGIPFYAIKHDLVILEEGLQRDGGSGRIDRGELRELQRKMLQTLEDLFLE